MFAGVKFLCDNTISIVSIGLIKNFKPPLEVNKSYQVFWSSNPEESPDNASKNVDKVYKTLYSRSQKKNISAPSGYFSAKILCTADTFEETRTSLESLGFGLDTKIVEKCSKSAVNKLKASAASSSIKAAMLKSSLVFTDDDSDVDQTVEPVGEYIKQIGLLESANRKLEATVEVHQRELNLMKEKISQYEEKNIFLSEQLSKTKGKYRTLKAEFKTARELNYDLQRKLINSLVLPDCDSVNPSLIQFNSECDSIDPPSSPSLLEGLKVNKRKLSTSIVSSQPSKISNVCDASENILPTEENSPAVKDGKDSYNLNDETIKNSGLGCKYGKVGDKVFVKNVAVNLFGRETLRNSSVTGRKPTTGGKAPRPALPKAGIAYIENLLRKRVMKELFANAEITEDVKRSILNERASSVIVVEAIGDKIATLRRAK